MEKSIYTLESWAQHVPLIQSGYHARLLTALDEVRIRTPIFPPKEKTFYALKRTTFDQVRVVIVGQDPYHGPGQAHGLAFSVPEGVEAPPSLRNIFKEIQDDIYSGEPRPFSTDLTRWATQGVLLLNASLTVEAGKAGSHRNLGWEKLTDQILHELASIRENIVFMLWGRHAQLKERLLEPTNHSVLKAPHPSPLSAYRGFFGCKHFSKANQYLVDHHHKPIEW